MIPISVAVLAGKNAQVIPTNIHFYVQNITCIGSKYPQMIQFNFEKYFTDPHVLAIAVTYRTSVVWRVLYFTRSAFFNDADIHRTVTQLHRYV